MSDKKQPNSTHKDVTVDVASEKIETIGSIEALEAYAGQEAADEEGRTGVKKAYKARKAELEEAAEESPEKDTATDKDSSEDEQPPAEVVSVTKAKIEALSEAVAKRVKAVKEFRPRGYDFDEVDQALFEAKENLEALAGEDGEEVDVPKPVLQEIVNAVALKVNRDQYQRGMQQPSQPQQSLIDAKAKANELEI